MSEAHYAARADTGDDVLYIELSGDLDLEDFEAAREEVIETATAFDGEFGIVTDISGLQNATTEEARPIHEAQRELEEMGVADVVRVVDDDTEEVVKMTFSVGSSTAGYDSDVAPTVEAAVDQLDV